MSGKNTNGADYVRVNDIWFTGREDVLEDGNTTFFICKSYDEYHMDEKTGDFVKYCKHKGVLFADGPECSLECDQYGRCETCRGFSAIRCQNCFVPRD